MKIRSSSHSADRKVSRFSGFTIVELLIVVVIIGILAAITIVAYNGIQQRARASAASSALDQAAKKLELFKVDNAAYPLTGNLAAAGVSDSNGTTFQYTSTSGTSYCITAMVGTVSYYVDSTAQTTPAQGGCNGQTWPGGVVMTNLVTNGDFSSGTSGWGKENANILAIVNGKIRLSELPTYSTIRIAQYHTLVQGHVYYVRVDGLAKQSSSMTSYDIQYYDLPLSKSIFSASLSAATTSYSAVFTISTSVSATTRFTVIGNGLTIGSSDYIEFSAASAIDLTAAFGVGTEPTKNQMDAIMQRFPNSWFNGTVTANTVGIL